MAGRKGKWKKVQEAWETDPREGFGWLREQFSIERFDDEWLAARAHREGWQKRPAGKTVPEASAAKPAPKAPRGRNAIGRPNDPVPKAPNPGAPVVSDPAMFDFQYATIPDLMESFRHRRQEYQKVFDVIAYRMSLLGASQGEVASVIGVAPTLIAVWRKKYPEFDAAFDLGGKLATATVATRLYQRAMGYSYMAEEIKMSRDDTVIRVPVVKHVPPDVGAATFILTNREPELWRNRVEVDNTHKVAEADWAKLDESHQKAAQKAEALRALYAERAQRLGLTLEHEDGALSEIEDADILGDDTEGA